MVDSRSIGSGFFGLLTVLGSTLLSAGELLIEWAPNRDSVKDNKLAAARGPGGSLAQEPTFDADGRLVFDGQQAITFPDAEARRLPLQDITVEARVRIDRPHDWGCVTAYSQDNGSHERGWILGYNGTHFCFKVSTGGPLTGATSSKAFTPGEWTHLAGYYDGQTVRLYVDGRLAASTPASGNIALPKQGTPFALGAYKDDDEYYPISGLIDYVKVSIGRPDAEDLARVKEQSQGAVFVIQPRVAFPEPTTAEISWQATEREAVLFYGSGETLDHKLACPGNQGRFVATLENLQPATKYRYRIGLGDGKQRRFSKIHSLDTRFNLSPVPVQPLAGTDPGLAKYCEDVLATLPDQSGYALVLGLTDGRLATMLAAKSRFHVIAADPDSDKVQAVRRTLYEAGLLGHRVSVLQLEDPEQIPWTERFADLILSERGSPVVARDECLRLLRPNGGTLLVPSDERPADPPGIDGQWEQRGPLFAFRRGEIKGARDWTHQYGTPGNASYTGEELGEVSATSGMALQWIGRPGGDFGIDRQPRMPAPLAANGRLYHQGMDRLVALNAYNGAVLWSYEIPALRRLNVAHDCSNWSADDNHLFVAIRDRLWILEARTGNLKHALRLPQDEREGHEWGFVANEGEVVIGSAVQSDSGFQNFWGGEAWFDQVGSALATSQICSSRLFGYHKADGKGLWAYGQGLVVNSTLALHDGKLYFLENRKLDLPEDATGRVSDRRLWLDLTAVCLDATTGEVLWEKPGPKPVYLNEKIGFVQAAYGVATDAGFLAVLSEGTVDSAGAYQKKGEFRCTHYNETGGVKWTTTSPWHEDHHGVHITHPAVTEDRLYLSPQAHDLATGKPLGIAYGPRRGCSTIVATKNALLFRILGEGNSPLGFWNQKTGSVSRFMRLRPSCWLNTLPAQGMLLIPEGGAGCSCGGWMETSVGFLPRSLNLNPPTP